MDLFPQNCELWGHTLDPSLLHSLHLALCLQGLGALYWFGGPVVFSWLHWPGMVFQGLPRSLLRMRKRNVGKQPCLQDIWWSVFRDPEFPGGPSGKEPACQCRRRKRHGFYAWVAKIPWRRAWQPTAVFLPGESHGQKRLAVCSKWGCKESDMTKWLNNMGIYFAYYNPKL